MIDVQINSFHGWKNPWSFLNIKMYTGFSFKYLLHYRHNHTISTNSLFPPTLDGGQLAQHHPPGLRASEYSILLTYVSIPLYVSSSISTVVTVSSTSPNTVFKGRSQVHNLICLEALCHFSLPHKFLTQAEPAKILGLFYGVAICCCSTSSATFSH